MREGVTLIQKYFPDLSPLQIQRFDMLWDLYQYWNARINVVSRKDIDELYLRHVLHSLSVARFFTFEKGISVLDVGTGGGFPGIPLSILFEDASFMLVDSIGKKIKVVNEVISALELDNAAAGQMRAEQVEGSFNFVVSRAVTDLSTFLKWIRKKIVPGGKNGIVYLKGGDLSEELKTISWPYKIYNLNEHFDEPFFDTKKLVHIRKT